MISLNNKENANEVGEETHLESVGMAYPPEGDMQPFKLAWNEKMQESEGMPCGCLLNGPYGET